MNKVFRNIYPKNSCFCECGSLYENKVMNNSDERLGGFLVPFIAGAAVSAPFWLVAGSNKAHQQYYQYPQPYPPQYNYYQPYQVPYVNIK